MKTSIGSETDRDLLIESGYRSPAHQAIVFITYLSYPRGNKDGVKFEPWHWQYRAEQVK